MKEDLMFYSAYQKFYAMAEKSTAFANYCKESFGEDFSQDGFSNMKQIHQIMTYLPKRENMDILDVGCGNGKLLKYIREKIRCRIYGFDYSENAIRTAISSSGGQADFKVGIIGEIDYPNESFDAVLSIDSIYFAKDMSKFVGQVKSWLKPDGIFIVGYQEGDVMKKTPNAETSVIAQAFRENNMNYEFLNITQDVYDLLLKKRETILKYKAEFESEGISEWFDVVLNQTNCVTEPFEEYSQNNARYIYIADKN